MKRREFLLGALAAVPIARGQQDPVTRFHLRVTPPKDPLPPGLHPLGLAEGRDGVLFIPEAAGGAEARPLLLMLHHAGGSGRRWFGPLRDRAESLGLIVVAPDSRGHNWATARMRVIPDFTFIEGALAEGFRRTLVDPARVAIGGFADGGSYALTLGLANGDLFSHVLAFSPGFYAETTPRGKPQVFLAHGSADTVFPVSAASRALESVLRERDYPVEYVEFEGGHELPGEVLQRGLERVAAPAPMPATTGRGTPA
ncbi:MAG: hypothetical protein JNJ98_12560 [Gemmatimonadetes bacterium]|nr:hypothetical protein [Gemmatimonadota bacterium]